MKHKKKIFLEELKDLVVYILPKKCRKDKDIVKSYVQSFLTACKEYKKL